MITRSLSSSCAELWKSFDTEIRWRIFFLVLLMTIVSFIEMLSLGAFFPLLTALLLQNINEYPLFLKVIYVLGVSKEDFLIFFSIFFGVTVIVSAALRMSLIFFQSRVSQIIGGYIGLHIYKKTLYQPYSVHISRHSSEIISTISTKVDIVVDFIVMPALLILGNIFILSAIVIALGLINLSVTLASFGLLTLIYALIFFLTRKNLSIWGQMISKGETKKVKVLQDGLGGVRDVLIGGVQEVYVSIYHNIDFSIRKSRTLIQAFGVSPKFIIEAGILSVVVLIVGFSEPTDILGMLPIFGVLALGAQRMLPLMQQIYSNWSAIRSAEASLIDVLSLLRSSAGVVEIEYKNIDRILFNESLELVNVSFKYSDQSPLIIKNLSLKINKGDRIGIFGASGQGKSTLVDLLTGLLEPVSGYFSVDGKEVNFANSFNWQKHISYVPQFIFLSDATILENIAFGLPIDQIDKNRAKWAAGIAQISEVIESYPNGYMTMTGEQGLKLSGGQRQRLGIARALYRSVDVLILDEATSALDHAMEDLVIEAINGLEGLTIISIAHRLSTLNKCFRTYKLSGGNLELVQLTSMD